MAFSSSIKMLRPIMRSMMLNGPRGFSRPLNEATYFSGPKLSPISQFQIKQARWLGSDAKMYSNQNARDSSIANILEREIQEETEEFNQRLSSDQFPGFSVETDGADVKLTKQVGDTSIIVRFTVSSSLSEWRSDQSQEQQQPEQSQDQSSYSLLSLPEFQIQINRNKQTLEVSCYFEELEHDEETGEPLPLDPMFNIDEIVMYEGEPKETEFAVSAEYFRDDLQDSFLNYLADLGLDEEFAKNLVTFATSYEKKQYIGLMRRLKDFVSK